MSAMAWEGLIMPLKNKKEYREYMAKKMRKYRTKEYKKRKKDRERKRRERARKKDIGMMGRFFGRLK